MKSIATTTSNLLVLLLSLLTVCNFGLSLKCDPNTEDTCTATCNGTKYDISKLMHGRKIIDTDDDDKTGNPKYEFVFSCRGIPCGNNNKSSTAVCQKEIKGDRSWSCGQATSVHWTIQSSNPLSMSVTYSNGDESDSKDLRKTKVLLTVAGSKDKLAYIGENNKAVYTFNFTVSSVSKLQSSPSGVAPGIIGWVLLCVGLICFVMYFIVGAIIMFAVKGARGLEVIPNFEFWKNFPFLLKDGFMLTITPCLLLANRKTGYENI